MPTPEAMTPTVTATDTQVSNMAGPITSPDQVDPNADPDPVAQQFTWENQDPQAAGYTPSRWNDVVDPSIQDPNIQMDPPGAAPSPIVKGKVAASHSGMTDRGLQRSKDLFGNVDADTAAMMKPEQDFNADIKDRYDQAGREMSSSIAGNADAEKTHFDAMRALSDRQTDFWDHAQNLETQATQQSQAESAQYVSGIRDQLAGVRQLIQQTGNPLARLSGSQVFGLGLASAAQGFLAARGVHIDVTGQVDRWVEQGMKEHQEMVENARGAVQDQFHLYEVARQSSQDAFEARQRYRAMVIEGFKSQIQSEAQRFGSASATAQAQAKLAQLDMDQTATLEKIGQNYFKTRLDTRRQLVDQAKDMGTLAIEKEKNQIDWAKVAAQKKANAKPVPNSMYISDPEYLKGADGKELQDSSGNRVVVNRWKVDPTQPPEIQGKVREEAGNARQNWATYKDATADLMSTYQSAEAIAKEHPTEFKAGGFEGLQRFDDTGAIARYLQSQNQWVMAKVYNDSGKAVNEEEFKRHQELARSDLRFELTSGKKVEQLQARLLENGREKFERNMEMPGLIKTQPGEPGYYDTSRTASPVAKSTANAIVNGKEPAPTAISTQEKFLGARDEGGDAGKASGGFGSYVGANSADNTGAIYEGEGAKTELHQPDWAVHMDMIARAAIDPAIANKVFKSGALTNGQPPATDQSDAEIEADAKEALRAASHGEHGESEAVQGYAKHLRALIAKDPAKARELLNGEAP